MLIYVYYSTPFFLLLIGFIFYFYPIQTINPLIGYRSKQSKQNQKKWDFAQVYSAKMSCLIHGLLLFFQIMVHLFKKQLLPKDLFWAIALQVLGVLLMFYLTEKKLKKIE